MADGEAEGKRTAASGAGDNPENDKDGEKKKKKKKESFLSRLFATGSAPWIATSFIALVAAISTPITTCVIENGKREVEQIKADNALRLANQKHQDERELANARQQHEIRMDFFQRAIDSPETTKYRASVLRFLVLSKELPVLCEWAEQELTTTETEIAKLRDTVAQLDQRLEKAQAKADRLATNVTKTKAETPEHRVKLARAEQNVAEIQEELETARAKQDVPPVPIIRTDRREQRVIPLEPDRAVASCGDQLAATKTRCEANCDHDSRVRDSAACKAGCEESYALGLRRCFLPRRK